VRSSPNIISDQIKEDGFVTPRIMCGINEKYDF